VLPKAYLDLPRLSGIKNGRRHLSGRGCLEVDRVITNRAGEVQKHKGGERCREGKNGKYRKSALVLKRARRGRELKLPLARLFGLKRLEYSHVLRYPYLVLEGRSINPSTIARESASR
jgi:hypothetical protein